MTLGEKLKQTRIRAGLTQEQLAVKLAVSRQAVTKWEADRGIPDIENLKLLAKTLQVSIDYLLDDGTQLSTVIFREEIHLQDYPYRCGMKKRWRKKTGRKDCAVRKKHPEAEICPLLASELSTKAEKIVDNVIGFLTDAPFGIPEFINQLKNLDKEFYLVAQNEQQFLVTVTDDFMESRLLPSKITGKTFEIGNFQYVKLKLLL